MVDVVRLRNAERKETITALTEMRKKIKRGVPKSVFIVYIAGHGGQLRSMSSRQSYISAAPM